MHPNNTIANSAAQYLCRSHRTMLMFRRDVRQFPKAKEMELRHQRSADVTLDVLQTTASGRRSIPPHVYKAMETLLPEAYKAGYKGKLLELWSEPASGGAKERVDRRRRREGVNADGRERERGSGSDQPESRRRLEYCSRIDAATSPQTTALASAENTPRPSPTPPALFHRTSMPFLFLPARSPRRPRALGVAFAGFPSSPIGGCGANTVRPA